MNVYHWQMRRLGITTVIILSILILVLAIQFISVPGAAGKMSNQFSTERVSAAGESTTRLIRWEANTAGHIYIAGVFKYAGSGVTQTVGRPEQSHLYELPIILK
jgi:hypothetical protein